MKAWKAFEQAAASLFNGKRFWANSGERLDFEGEIPYSQYTKTTVRGQCKLVQKLSLENLTKLAEEKDVDVVCIKVRRGKGKRSPMLVVFTEENYRRLHFSSISSAPTEAPCVPSSPSLPSQLAANTSHLPSGPIHFSVPIGLEYLQGTQRSSLRPFKS